MFDEGMDANWREVFEGVARSVSCVVSCNISKSSQNRERIPGLFVRSALRNGPKLHGICYGRACLASRRSGSADGTACTEQIARYGRAGRTAFGAEGREAREGARKGRSGSADRRYWNGLFHQHHLILVCLDAARSRTSRASRFSVPNAFQPAAEWSGRRKTQCLSSAFLSFFSRFPL